MTVTESPPLSSSVTDVPLARPDTFPPTVYVVLTAQVTETLVMFDEAIVPVPLVTVQVSPAGCVPTVTAYIALESSAVWKVKLVFEDTVRESPPLSSRITDVPLARPETLPPMV